MTDPQQDPDPSLEGSPTACAVLRTLARHPAGLTLAALHQLLELDERSTRAALIGLSERRRIRCIGTGTDARWFTVLHAAAAEARR